MTSSGLDHLNMLGSDKGIKNHSINPLNYEAFVKDQETKYKI